MLGAGLLGSALVDQVVDGDWRGFQRVTATAEDLLELHDPAITDLVTLGLLEGMHNAASHVSVEMGNRLRNELPPGCRGAWDDVHDKLEVVRAWMIDTHQSIQQADGRQLGSAELERLFRINYWRSPDGGLIGLADVVDHDQDRARRDQQGFS